MASNAAVLVVAFLVASFFIVGEAQSCTNIMAMSSCLAPVMGTGSPTAACCSAISEYRSKPACLCTLLQTAQKSNIKVNYATAVAIPKNCNYGQYVPKGYVCNGYTVPSSIEN